jgi:hypothetical protein
MCRKEILRQVLKTCRVSSSCVWRKYWEKCYKPLDLQAHISKENIRTSSLNLQSCRPMYLEEILGQVLQTCRDCKFMYLETILGQVLKTCRAVTSCIWRQYWDKSLKPVELQIHVPGKNIGSGSTSL